MVNIMMSLQNRFFWIITVYLYAFKDLVFFLKHHNPALFVGFNATLIYGLFHETYKLGQGTLFGIYLGTVGY